MPVLMSLLFPDPPLVRTPARLFAWWESRRPSYNLVVGGAGLVTTGLIELLRVLPGPLHGVPLAWPLIVVYGVVANVCYSAGWMVEAVVQRWLGRKTYGLGPALFRHGLVFSVGLTLFPAALAVLATAVGLLSHFFR